MPSVSEKQRKFFGAELGRKQAGESTDTGMSEKSLADFAKKPVEPKRGAHSDKKHQHDTGRHKRPRGG